MIGGAASLCFGQIREAAPAFAALLPILTAMPAQGQVRLVGPGPGRPSVSAEVVPGSIVRRADALSLRISVEVPREHHGYIDKGDDGFFIPFSFSFPDFEGTEAGVEMTAAPAGRRDDGVRAQVLRGRGEYGFLLVPAAGPDTETTASLRYQICNDLTARCYPPAKVSIPIFLKRGGGCSVPQRAHAGRRALAVRARALTANDPSGVDISAVDQTAQAVGGCAPADRLQTLKHASRTTSSSVSRSALRESARTSSALRPRTAGKSGPRRRRRSRRRRPLLPHPRPRGACLPPGGVE